MGRSKAETRKALKKAMHHFDPQVAEKVGVNGAVVYQNIQFWCSKNAETKTNIRDGRAWHYASRTDLGKLFPYLTDSQLRTAVEKLVASGLVLRGEYNQANYDKTTWYTVPESADWVRNAIGEKSPMEQSEIANGSVKNRQPIPDISTDISNPPIPPEGDDVSEVQDPPSSRRLKRRKEGDPFKESEFEEFWQAYPRKVGPDTAKRNYKRSLKIADAKTIIYGPRRYADQVKREQTELRWVPYPGTWLQNKGWTTSNEPVPYYRRVLEAQKTGRLV